MTNVKLIREVTQYIVIYGEKEYAKFENFPDVYSASLWVKNHGGYILKEVSIAEVEEND